MEAEQRYYLSFNKGSIESRAVEKKNFYFYNTLYTILASNKLLQQIENHETRIKEVIREDLEYYILSGISGCILVKNDISIIYDFYESEHDLVLEEIEGPDDTAFRVMEIPTLDLLRILEKWQLSFVEGK